MRALLQTLLQIANQRDDEFSKHAIGFLESTTPSDWVLLAMCADASDEMLLLIRFHDDEAAEVACIGQKLSECITNLQGLFGDSSSCLTRMCFTSQMLKTLRRPMVLGLRRRKKVRLHPHTMRKGSHPGLPPFVFGECLPAWTPSNELSHVRGSGKVSKPSKLSKVKQARQGNPTMQAKHTKQAKQAKQAKQTKLS